ncbi:hypothetical protein [Amycolatopsis sp. NPDC051061]
MFDETRSTLSSHDRTTVRGPVESPGTDGAREAVCTLRQVSGKLTGPVLP